MWKSVIFSLFLILQITSFLPRSEGLTCYTCWDEATAPERLVNGQSYYGIDGDKSCGRGKIPDKKLKKTCLPPTDSMGKENDAVCAQIYVEVGSATGTIRLTVRSCFHANKTIDDLTGIEHSCGDRTYRNLLDLAVGNMKDALENVSDQVPSNTTGEFCSCNTDDCNMATGLKGGTSVMILLMGFIALHQLSFF